jgi:hypothetical protein
MKNEERGKRKEERGKRKEKIFVRRLLWFHAVGGLL